VTRNGIKNMSLSAETYSIQSKLGMYCRDGLERPLPGLTEGRLDQYRRLVYNIVNDNLESAYPITFEHIDREVWNEMLYEFFSKHECKSYQIWRFPKEFYEYALKANFSERFNIPM